MPRLLLLLLFALSACWGSNAHILEGTVVEVVSDSEVVIDHKAVPGVMGPMVMPFTARDPGTLADVTPGDQVIARLMKDDQGFYLDKVRITGHTEPPKAVATGPKPVQPGSIFPTTELPVADGGTVILGEGQDRATVVTFLYTTCPFPEMCPATVLRLQGLSEQLAADDAIRLLIVTLDPTTDTPEALAEWAPTVGVTQHWTLARPEGEPLQTLAMRAAMQVMEEDGTIMHGLRWLVLDADGRLVERYDDNRFPTDRMLQQLRTGEPHAPAGIVGTVTPE